MRIFLCVSASVLLVANFGTRADDAGQPPVANRPDNFQGAVGQRFTVTLRATPTAVQAEDPLTLTVRIAGQGNLKTLPRPNLRQNPRFARKFRIDDLADRYLPAEQAREFDYRLRPLTAEIKEIPPLRFAYFRPGFIPPEKGYQQTTSNSVPLQVTPRAEVVPNQVQGATQSISYPDTLYQIATGASVLRSEERYVLPSPWALGLLLLVPPGLCAAWYGLWRRRHPDTARQSRQRRSRAARHALKALGARPGTDAREQAARVEAVLTEYLRQRLDWRVEVPTPAEASAVLLQRGTSPELARAAAQFFAASAAVQFAPGLAENAGCGTDAATRLILALESLACP
jgi:hypothetical protein